MGAGARLAEERGRWADHWRVIDLDRESEHLLDTLDPGEELRAAVPGLQEREPRGADPVLIGVTDRRVLVVGPGAASAAGREVRVADATGVMTRLIAGGTFTVLLADMPGGVVELDLDPAALDRLREHVDGLGAWPAPTG